jgi:plastocyanin
VSRVLVIALAAYAASGLGQSHADLQGTTSAGGHPVADAVVWLDAPAAPRRTTPREVVLDQRNLSFSPHVLAVQVGTTVKFPNGDRVFHNVFSFHDGQKFDLGLYPVGAVKHVPFDRPGLSRIFCNIHPKMAAYVMVVDTPYFAVSDQAGAFTIANVPAGTYRYHAWRPGGALLNDTVIVSSGTSFQVRWP